ncbi:Uncharacterised protein [Salmonella enterica subsp. enterica]|nr:Uncharacterised protein [Salmonella enterica subsp. enterica] [Salmonella enterica subsp. enterica serovar Menston]
MTIILILDAIISRFCERKRGVENFKYVSRLKITIDIEMVVECI